MKNNYTKSILIKCTPEQKEYWSSAAAAAEIPLSVFVRRLLDDAASPAPVESQSAHFPGETCEPIIE